MAVYYKDDSRLFDAALGSVYSNTIYPFEVIVVQDGPVGEDIADVINKFSHFSGFKCVRLERNHGLSYALNIGIKQVTTEFVFRADADDLNLPDRFSKQLPLLMAGFDIVGGSILEIDRMGRPIAIRRVPCEHHEIQKHISTRNPFNHMTVAFRASAVRNVGGYPLISLKEDYGLWALLISSGAIAVNLNDILVRATAGAEMYRRRGGLKYVASEIKLQKLLVDLRFQSFGKAIVIGILRSFVFLLPASVRGLIYEKVLRSRA